MRTQLLGHFYLENNMGDEALYRQVMMDVKSIDPNGTVGKGVDDKDILILGGGGMYSDWQPEGFDTWLPPIRKAIRHNIPVVAYGIGVGPLFTDKGKQRLRTVFDDIELIMVRDQYSKEQLGIDRAIVTADPAVRYVDTPIKIGVNFASIPVEGLDKYLEGLSTYLVDNFEVEFVCLWPHHKPYMEQIAKPLGIPVIEAHDPDKFKKIVLRYNYWIGMQLHGCMLAMMSGIEAVFLAYHPKCMELHHETIPISHRIIIGDGKNMEHISLSKQLHKTIETIEYKWSWHKNLRRKSQMNVTLLKKFCVERGLLK